jgi:glycosyltransferase involved in cell wall biosynthesis
MYRILRIHNRLIVGGPSHNVTLLSRYLEPEFETRLVVGQKDPHEKDGTYLAQELGLEPIVVEEMRRSVLPFNDIRAYFRIKRMIREFKPDIVHTHASKSGAIGRLAAHACNVKLVVHTFHGHVFHSYFNKFISWGIIQVERFLARKSHIIVAISDQQRHELVNIYQIAPAEKVFTVPLGFNLDKYMSVPVEQRHSFRDKYHVAADEIVVGIVGRIVPIKNHEMFIEVAAEVKKQCAAKIRFVIIGDGESLPLIQKRCDELQLSYSYFPDTPNQLADVTVTSWETNMAMALAGIDIVVLTSHNEGTPVSLIEAMAAEKPVVATRVGGVQDVIDHNVNGYITEVDDVKTFASHVVELINDPAKRKALGQSGQAKVRNIYSKERLVNDMRKLYLRYLEPSTAR